MKKLLFSAYDLNVGGIETSLLTLLNTLAKKDYDITLLLEKKQGTFLTELNDKIHIIEYNPCTNKIVLIRKTVNLMKRIGFILKYKNKFDFSAAYATYSQVASFTAKIASSNNALWGHADYLALFHGDTQKVRNFFNKLHVQEFKHIIFVSNAGAKSFISIFPEEKEKVLFCNNLVNDEKIRMLAEENIEETKQTYTFVNIGRHDEQQKKLTRIIEATKRLKDEQYDFQVWFIGSGQDTNYYKELVKQYKIEDYIKFYGAKKNPYPYMKLADSVILSSDYEGYPVVFLEAFILKKPIITTDVSDAKEDVQNQFGKVVEKDIDAICQEMKEFIKTGYDIKNKFDPSRYNQEIIQKLEKLFP